MISALTIRALRAADIVSLADVVGRAYASDQDAEQREQRIGTYLRTPAVATFVAELDGRPVGMVVGNDYGPVAYVAQMAVDPAVQRRGIGRALMDALIAWADERGFPAVELDATTVGEPLYRRYGFVEVSRTVVAAATAEVPTPHDAPASTPDERAPRPFVAADRAGLFALDVQAFGADRRDALGLLLEASATTALVTTDALGVVDGFAIAQRRQKILGPIVAKDAGVAGRLIDAARVGLPRAHRMHVPADDAGIAAALLEERGYRRERSLAHMIRGTRPPARREMLFARINLGQG